MSKNKRSMKQMNQYEQQWQQLEYEYKNSKYMAKHTDEGNDMKTKRVDKPEHAPIQLLIIIVISTSLTWINGKIPNSLWIIKCIITVTDVVMVVGISLMEMGKAGHSMYILMMGLLYKYMGILSQCHRIGHASQDSGMLVDTGLWDNELLKLVHGWLYYSAYSYSIGYTNISTGQYVCTIVGSVGVGAGLHLYSSRYGGLAHLMWQYMSGSGWVYAYCLLGYIYRTMCYPKYNDDNNTMHRWRVCRCISNALTTILHLPHNNNNSNSNNNSSSSSSSSSNVDPHVGYGDVIWMIVWMWYVSAGVGASCVSMGVLVVGAVYGGSNGHSIQYIDSRHVNIIISYVILYLQHTISIYYNSDGVLMYVYDIHVSSLIGLGICYMYISIQPYVLQHRWHILSTSSLLNITMLIPNTYTYNNNNNIRYNSIYSSSRCSIKYNNDRIYMKSIILCKVTIVWLIVCECAILYSINNYIHAFNYNNSINNNNSNNNDSDGVVLLGWVLPGVLVLCAYYIINLYKHHAITYSYYNNNNSNNNNNRSHNYTNYTSTNNSSTNNSSTNNSNNGVGYSQRLHTYMHTIIYILLSILSISYIYTHVHTHTHVPLLSSLAYSISPTSTVLQHHYSLYYQLHACTDPSPTHTTINYTHSITLLSIIILTILNRLTHTYTYTYTYTYRYIRVAHIIIYYTCIIAIYINIITSIYHHQCTTPSHYIHSYLYILVTAILAHHTPTPSSFLSTHKHKRTHTHPSSNQ